jgi:4-amino-4-deoxy-L-arabinose transferase-like glycosyltransferase
VAVDRLGRGRHHHAGPAAAPGENDRQADGSAQSPTAAEDAWPYTTIREGHPPLTGIVIAVGMRVAPAWFDPLTAARLGPILLFSFAAGAMFYRLQREYEVLAVSLMAVASLVLMPRVFAHAHYATLDGPLTACWVLAWAAFAPACRQWRWIPVFGLALGLTLCSKFSGWLAPLPFIAWTVLYRDRGGLCALAVGVPLAVLVFVLLNPPLWHQPLAGLGTFFDLNLHRGARPELNISTQFFGRMYNLDHPLPFYNALVWTVITVSPLLMIMGFAGIVGAVKRWHTDRAGALLVCQWATLIIVRALPWAPPHDAERLILPSFAFFAALVGLGFGRGLYRETLLKREKIVPQGWAKVAIAIALVAGLLDSIGYFPHGLSFYSRLIGGVRGATALGMEPTYYWDALDRPTLDWLKERTIGDEKVAFGAAPKRNLELLKRWGLLSRLPSDPGMFRWYVIQRRPSALQAVDHWLIEHEEPDFERTLSGVPLLDVYSYDKYERALAATH